MVQPIRLVTAALEHAAWWLGYQTGPSGDRGAQDAKADGRARRPLASVSRFERGEPGAPPERPAR